MVEKKHLEYWQKRVDEIIRYADQIDIDVFAEIARIYLEEAKLVQKELFAFYQRFVDDNGLTLQEAMYQLRHEDMSDYQQNAKRYFEQAEKDPELLKRLNEQYASARATRMDLLNLELTWRAGVLATSISSTFENHLLKTAKYAYRKAGDRRGTINEPALRELIRTPINGKNYSEHIWGNVDKLAEDLREVFRRGFIRGLHPREMAQEIAKKYNVARSRAQTIIRTDGTAIISNSVAKRYIDAGLKYYRILVHLDDRTTDICRQIAKEGKRYELSEMKAGLNAPPFHYNCRSGIVPDEGELSSSIVPGSDKLLELSSDKAYNQDMITLDLMAKQRSFTVGTDIRVKAKKLRGTEFDFWVQDNTKKIRDTVANIQSVFSDLDGYVKPTVVFLKKSRLPGYAGYDYRQDILFVSDALSSNEEFSRLLLDNYFAAGDIRETMIHELTHKQHWDSAKAFYKANKKRYNNVEQAMSELNSPLVSYIKEQQKSDYNYLYGISDNAAIAFYENNVHELVAEVGVLGDRVPDSILLNKVKEVLSWK